MPPELLRVSVGARLHHEDAVDKAVKGCERENPQIARSPPSPRTGPLNVVREVEFADSEE
jgi:hypothetical protein